MGSLSTEGTAIAEDRMADDRTVSAYTPTGGAAPEDLADYRILSKSALIAALLLIPAAIFAVFSISLQMGTEALPGVLPLPLVGIVLSVVGLNAIRRYPKEYAGKWLAEFALAAHVLLILGTMPYHFYVQATEVPEGYQRISFAELQPDPEKGEYGIPQRAVELTGKRIFIKGYIHPGVASAGKVDQFILVKDFGTCCFGGQPEPTHMVEVKITGNASRIPYSQRIVRLAGTFALAPRQGETLGVQNVLYRLEADYVKP